MHTDIDPPRRVAVAANPQIEEASELGLEIAGYLNERETEAVHGPLNDETFRKELLKDSFDMVLALGGDGTMLRVGRLCAPHQMPILGINVGRVGFLTEVKRDGWRPAVDRVLAGDFWIERRMMLLTEHNRSGERLGSWSVLNECVVGRGEIVRPVRLVAEADERYLATYVADALIASTATGSTAYALAAGGPVLPPELRSILLVPVAPHFSFNRAIVLDEAATVRITIHTDHKAILSVDGQLPVSLEDGDQVEVCASEHVAAFVRLQDPGYFYRNLTFHLNSQSSLREVR